MRISDWSSDVCSSDLALIFAAAAFAAELSRPEEFSVAMVSIIGVLAIVLWSVGFVVLWVIKSTFKRYIQNQQRVVSRPDEALHVSLFMVENTEDRTSVEKGKHV